MRVLFRGTHSWRCINSNITSGFCFLELRDNILNIVNVNQQSVLHSTLNTEEKLLSIFVPFSVLCSSSKAILYSFLNK